MKLTFETIYFMVNVRKCDAHSENAATFMVLLAFY